MYKSPLKVFGEYLIEPQAAAASMPGGKVVRAGRSISGLEVVVCLEGDKNDPAAAVEQAVGDTITISLQHSLDGETFIALPSWEQTINAPKDDPAAVTVSFTPGSIMARLTLPCDCLPFIKGSLAMSNPLGKVSMFPAYLPR